METKERKIAFCINQIHDGGAERVIVNLANDFNIRGYKVFMITSHKYEDEYPLNSEIIRYVLDDYGESQNKLVKNIRWIKIIRNICKSEGIDCIIGFMRESNVRVIISTLGLPTVSIIAVRGNPQVEYGGKGGRFIKQWILPLADGCVLQTHDSLECFTGGVQKKAIVIPNPIGESFFNVERKPVKGRIVTCGRLDPIKNHPMLIRAFSRIKREHKESALEIYGIGAEREALQNLIEELGVADSAFLRGKTDHVESVLSSADIFVLSSDSEGMPNALMEAMAAGVPSISTDCPCGGPRALIESEKNGLLVPVNDSEALASAIEKLLKNTALSETIGKKAKESAKKYETETIFGQWKTYVEQIISMAKKGK